jgi:hypothetical protein
MQGLCFCEFQLYTSLTELQKRERVHKAEFLHVAAKEREDAIDPVVEITKALIVAFVDNV